MISRSVNDFSKKKKEDWLRKYHSFVRKYDFPIKLFICFEIFIVHSGSLVCAFQEPGSRTGGAHASQGPWGGGPNICINIH